MIWPKQLPKAAGKAPGERPLEGKRPSGGGSPACLSCQVLLQGLPRPDPEDRVLKTWRRSLALDSRAACRVGCRRLALAHGAAGAELGHVTG